MKKRYINRENIILVVSITTLVLVGIDIYFSHFYGPHIEIINCPEYASTTSENRDINFSFLIYNKGRETSFFNFDIYPLSYDSITKSISYNIIYEGYIGAGETKEIDVIFHSPHKSCCAQYELILHQYYGKNIRNNIEVCWGEESNIKVKE